MNLPDITQRPEVRELVGRALKEDLGRGDATSEALVPEDKMVRAGIVARRPCVVSGTGIAALTFLTLDPAVQVNVVAGDGAPIDAGATILIVQGRARSILAGERVALNFLQRMTGIATLTDQYVRKAAPHGVSVLDTRKTTPTLRVLEKYAVLCGGGANHRFGLYDRVLIKDNHRALWAEQGGGDLAGAVRAARAKFPGLEIEIEVESEEELRQVLPACPDWVLLDNMSPAMLAACVGICKGKCRMEASGGITLATMEEVARTGVDAISVGALTHSAPAADLSLEVMGVDT